MEISKLTAELEDKEIKLQYRQHSFVAWRITEQIKGLLPNENTEFQKLGEFWDDYGFSDEPVSAAKSDKNELREVSTAKEAIDHVKNMFSNLKPKEQIHNE